ncbi:MAG: hypothetical protein UY93_C0002G0047 [Parcubacteria group bacterium GW2011_GWA1_56_13]|nr:MAG: hypothetical protein UY93_C0002G0047 [Parcubacteria group bacterium GW2011_GWA1_56_13]
MSPDAIIVFPAGIVPLNDVKTEWRSTTYDENDAFGTLGGHDRVRAAALLARRYPTAAVVTTSHTLGRPAPTLADVYENELIGLGVARERILKEESSNTTRAGLVASLELARRKRWKRLLFVSSGFHVPRIRAFLEQEHNDIDVKCAASEPLLSAADPSFAAQFAAVQDTPAYKKRLVSEERGIQAIKSGDYRSASAEDKLEREA